MRPLFVTLDFKLLTVFLITQQIDERDLGSVNDTRIDMSHYVDTSIHTLCIPKPMYSSKPFITID